MVDKKFIVWNPDDGEPRHDDEGNCISDGIIGRVGPDNVYVKTYAAYDPGSIPIEDMLVGDRAMASFRLSGEHGRYYVLRVQ